MITAWLTKHKSFKHCCHIFFLNLFKAQYSSKCLIIQFLLPLLTYVSSTLMGKLLQTSLQLSLSIQSCISSTFPPDGPLLSMFLLTWSSLCVHGLPQGLFPVIFICSNLFGILCSYILLTCLNSVPTSYKY
jgi:hypothetical protein